MRTDWIVPILEDLHNFALEQRMTKLAEDLGKIITEHGPVLRGTETDQDDVVQLINPKESGTPNGG